MIKTFYRLKDRFEEWLRYPQPSYAQKKLLGLYTDVIDTDFTATRLASEATADYIIRHGISKDRVKHKGYGEEQPVNGCVCEGQIKTTCTAKELQLNRRTDFLILKK